ncbi:MAG: ATP-dependent nuclease [Planctomycetota bacterium]|jgi:putative ATP-dependent endonuclease of OLD family
MRLTRVFIENFRGIRRLKLKLDPITVIIGENNHGKTSVFDALCLCLGRPGSALPTHFREGDFHRPHGEIAGEPPDSGLRRRRRRGNPRPIRIALTFTPTEEGHPPPSSPLNEALTEDHDGGRRLRVEFWGQPDNTLIAHRFVDQEGRPLDPQPSESTLFELRRLHPVLLLRFAQRAPPEPTLHADAKPETRAEQRGRRELEADVARVYHELATARGPVPKEHLRRGLTAAHELYEGLRLRRVTSLAPMQGMLDQLVPDPEAPADAEHRRELDEAGSGSHTLGLLLVLGALLDVRGDNTLPADSDPIIAIEEPEVHLHPILLASTWDVIEGLGAQTLVTTNSGELLSSVPMRLVRRLTRKDGQIHVRQLPEERLSTTELRRVGYHIRAKRGAVLFARCWLLVEGESEFWLLRELARVLGYDLEAEGVRCVEFAQCGVAPLLKLANDLGIEWHLLSDGDESGGVYAHEARQYLNGGDIQDHITRLARRDIERCFWYHGYEDVYRKAARIKADDQNKGNRAPGKVIAKAVRAYSKPYLAISVAEAAAERGPSGVPPTLRHVIETSVRLAREAVREVGA